MEAGGADLSPEVSGSTAPVQTSIAEGPVVSLLESSQVPLAASFYANEESGPQRGADPSPVPQAPYRLGLPPTMGAGILCSEAS